MSVNINHQLEQVNNLKITTVGSGATVGSAGIVTYYGDGSNLNFDYLQAPFGSTVTFTVTVASKDATHRYNGTGSSNGYLINGVQAPFLTLTPGRTYRFTNDNTGNHPLKFYLEADKTTEYTSGVSFQNTYTEIAVSDETPSVLHYQCTAHGYMGNAIQVNSNVVNTNYPATIRSTLDVTGVSTFTGNIQLPDNTVLRIGAQGDLRLYHTGSENIIWDNYGITKFLGGQWDFRNLADNQTAAHFDQDAGQELYYNGTKRFETTNTGSTISGDASVSGEVTAASYKSNDTTGDGSDVGFAIKYYITSSGSSAYRFAGPGLVNTTNNPTLYLHRGFTYIFENSTGSSHPFRIQFTNTSIGVTTYLSGSNNGTQVFTIPFDAPSSYEYQCTLHSGMKGTLAIPT
jgi:plastocyanin